MVLFKYGFIFLAGAGLGAAAMAHRGEGCCDRRRHGASTPALGGGGHRHELDPAAAAASYEDERRGYRFRPSSDEGSMVAEEGKHRAVRKSKKPSAAAVATTSDY